MEKNDIILNNEKLGIKTIFFNEDNGILGYTENNIIYLNEFYDKDLELVNKHEVLHLFEQSKQFVGTKKIIFSLLGEKELNRLRADYYLKYSGLYTEEEINNGILDNEIAIDIIIGNGVFILPIHDYIPNAYETIVSQKESITLTSEARRYLSLTVDRKTAERYSKLGKWDLLFASKYYEGKEKPTGNDRYDIIKFDSLNAYDALSNFFGMDFRISVIDNPYLDRRVQEIIKIHEAKGEYEIANELKVNSYDLREELASEYRNSLFRGYLALIKLLNDSDYEYSFKYLILNEVLTKTYRYENGNRIVDKREKGKTILPLMLVNEFILKEIHDNIDRYQSFTDLYFDSLDKYNKEFLKSEGLDESEIGHWIKFDQGREGTSKLIKDAQDLENLIRNTPWCTRKCTAHHLKEGDFYVFVDGKGNPRIAVKFSGNIIEEVRGIKGAGDQEIEDEYRQIAIDFLQDNIKIFGAQLWLDKEKRNQVLFECLTKIKNGTFTDEDIDVLVKNLNMKEVRVHADINSNERDLMKEIINNKELRDRIANHSSNAQRVIMLIDEIERNNRTLNYIKKLEDGTLKEEDCTYLYDDLLYNYNEFAYVHNQNDLIQLINSTDNVFKDMMASKFGCEPNEVHIGRLTLRSDFDSSFVLPLKIVIGDLSLMNINGGVDLSNLQIVKGNLFIKDTEKMELSSLKKVDGDVRIDYNDELNLSSLEVVGGTLDCLQLKECDMSSLRIVKGDFICEFYGGAEHYDSLEEIHGNLKIDSSIKSMKRLKVVKGIISWDKFSTIEDFPNLEECGGFAEGVPDKIVDKFKYDEERDCYVKRMIKR
jgi:hypothetical protein